MRRIAAGAAMFLLLTGCGGTVDSVPAASPTGVTLPPGGRFDYQIGGAYPPGAGVAVVSRDRSDPSAPGVYSICYVNAYQSQPAETGWWREHHPDLLTDLEDPDWPGEYLLDLSTVDKRARLAAVVGPWLDGCAAAGYRAVEPDNLDSWTRSHGRFDATAAVAYARLLAARAHARGLAVAQKNAAELGDRGRAAGLDFAVTEDCRATDECADYAAVYGPHVLDVEYDPGAFRAACRDRLSISVILRDRDVVPAGRPGYRYLTC